MCGGLFNGLSPEDSMKVVAPVDATPAASGTQSAAPAPTASADVTRAVQRTKPRSLLTRSAIGDTSSASVSSYGAKATLGA